MNSEFTLTGILKFCLSPLDGDPFNLDSGNQILLKPSTIKKTPQLSRQNRKTWLWYGMIHIITYRKLFQNMAEKLLEHMNVACLQQYINRNCETQWPRNLNLISLSSDCKSLQLPSCKHLLEADNDNYSKACWLFEAAFNAQLFKHIWFSAEHTQNSTSNTNIRQRLRVQ